MEQTIMMRIKFLLMFLTLIPLRRSLSVGEPPPPPQPLDSYVSRQLKLNLAVYLYWDPYVRVDPGKRFSYHTKKGWQNSVLGFLAAAQPRHLQREVLAEVRRLVVGEKMLGGSVSECEGDGGRRAAKVVNDSSGGSAVVVVADSTNVACYNALVDRILAAEAPAQQIPAEYKSAAAVPEEIRGNFPLEALVHYFLVVRNERGQERPWSGKDENFFPDFVDRLLETWDGALENEFGAVWGFAGGPGADHGQHVADGAASPHGDPLPGDSSSCTGEDCSEETAIQSIRVTNFIQHSLETFWPLFGTLYRAAWNFVEEKGPAVSPAAPAKLRTFPELEALGEEILRLEGMPRNRALAPGFRLPGGTRMSLWRTVNSVLGANGIVENNHPRSSHINRPDDKAPAALLPDDEREFFEGAPEELSSSAITSEGRVPNYDDDTPAMSRKHSFLLFRLFSRKSRKNSTRLAQLNHSFLALLSRLEELLFFLGPCPPYGHLAPSEGFVHPSLTTDFTQFLICIPERSTATSMVGAHWSALGGWPDSIKLYRAAEKRNFWNGMLLSKRTISSTEQASSPTERQREDSLALDFLDELVGARWRLRLNGTGGLSWGSTTPWAGPTEEGHWCSGGGNDNEDGRVKAMVDVGAHIGSVSLYFAAKGFRVLAVEASLKNVRFLRASVAANRLENLVTVVHCAATGAPYPDKDHSKHDIHISSASRGPTSGGGRARDNNDEQDDEVYIEDPQDSGIGLLVPRARFEAAFANVTFDSEARRYMKVDRWTREHFIGAAAIEDDGSSRREEALGGGASSLAVEVDDISTGVDGPAGSSESTTLSRAPDRIDRLIAELNSGEREALNVHTRKLVPVSGVPKRRLDGLILEWVRTWSGASDGGRGRSGRTDIHRPREDRHRDEVAAALNSIALVKIDTEGHDHAVLSSMGLLFHSSAKAKFSPVLFLEANVMNCQVKRGLDPGLVATDLQELLRGCGYGRGLEPMLRYAPAPPAPMADDATAPEGDGDWVVRMLVEKPGFAVEVGEPTTPRADYTTELLFPAHVVVGCGWGDGEGGRGGDTRPAGGPVVDVVEAVTACHNRCISANRIGEDYCSCWSVVVEHHHGDHDGVEDAGRSKTWRCSLRADCRGGLQLQKTIGQYDSMRRSNEDRIHRFPQDSLYNAWSLVVGEFDCKLVSVNSVKDLVFLRDVELGNTNLSIVSGLLGNDMLVWHDVFLALAEQ